jgi:RNA polymerase sigma-70 factor (ECF subfamily)
MVGDINIAREIIQESFLKLCRQQESEIEPLLPSWLFRVSRNLAIDHLRKEKRMKTSNLQTIDEWVADRRPYPDAHEKVVNSETNQSIQIQVQQLPPSQQEVIRLRFENQLSYRQIADITGHTPTNVGFLLHTAIHKLRGALCES